MKHICDHKEGRKTKISGARRAFDHFQQQTTRYLHFHHTQTNDHHRDGLAIVRPFPQASQLPTRSSRFLHVLFIAFKFAESLALCVAMSCLTGKIGMLRQRVSLPPPPWIHCGRRVSGLPQLLANWLRVFTLRRRSLCIAGLQIGQNAWKKIASLLARASLETVERR